MRKKFLMSGIVSRIAMSGIAKRVASCLPEILVLLLCAVLLLFDISHKKGYHMDELLSFELANAEFNPWIVPTQPQGRLAKFVENELRGESFGETLSNLKDTLQDILQNRGSSKILSYQADVYGEPVWIERQQFIDYITVGREDAFNYLSVYFNVKDDNHPPLHFMVLHTVSSIFRGRLTPLMGCGINLVCVLGIMLLLMRMGRQLMTFSECQSGGRIAGLSAAAVYGLSAGAMSTTLLIRMYGMLSLWCVALLALHLQKIRRDVLGGEGFERKNKLLMLVTVLGFWTQYFFLFYCLILAAVTAVILWREGRKKELWRYIRSMAAAAVIGIAVFPFAIQDVFSSGRGVEALENLSSGLDGYGIRLAAFGKIMAERIGVWCLLTAAAVVIGCGIYFLWKRGSAGAKALPQRRAGGVGALLVLPVAGYFLLAARMSPYLVDRYIMPLFPLAVLLLVTAAMRMLWGLLRARKLAGGSVRLCMAALAVALSMCALWNPERYRDSYLYSDYAGQEAVAEKYREYPCLCIFRGVEYYWNLLEFTHYDKTLLLTLEELENREERDSIEELGEVVVLLKHTEDEERLRKIMEGYGFEMEETLWRTREPGADTVFLFSRAVS